MARTLSIVVPGARSEDVVSTMAEAAADMLAHVLADSPTVLMFIWEREGEPVQMGSLPGSVSLMEGMISRAADKLFPGGSEN